MFTVLVLRRLPQQNLSNIKPGSFFIDDNGSVKVLLRYTPQLSAPAIPDGSYYVAIASEPGWPLQVVQDQLVTPVDVLAEGNPIP